MAQSREFYIPKGARKVAMKNGAAEFYLTERAGWFIAMAFVGRAQKPTWHYRFSTEAKRAKRIEETIANVSAWRARKDAEKAMAKAEAAKGHGWEKGLILYSSWGYEQTNVDFYEVVEVIGATMVKVEEIGSVQATDDTGGGSSMSNYVVPDIGKRSGTFMRCKVIRGHIKVSSCSNASVWDGRKKYCSWYA